MEAGIVNYGTYIPKHRIDVNDIFKVWRNVTPETFNKMSLSERVVLMPDEDSITLGVNAAQLAMDRSGLKREDIGGERYWIKAKVRPTQGFERDLRNITQRNEGELE